MIMREIKFRAWDSDSKTMVYAPNHELFAVFETVKDDDSEYVLMQFTGLLDKTGKEIYEGDIVRFMGINLQVGFYNAHFIIYDEVVEKGGTGHEDLWKALERGEVEVIGNIYENSELLK